MSRARNAYAAPAWAAEQRVRDVGSKAVLLTLANYADEAFTCFPGQETLAEETEQSVRQVRRQVAYLEALGLIRRQKRYNEQGKRTSDRYHLLLDVTVAVAMDDPRRAILSGEPVAPAHDATVASEPAMGSEALPDSLAGSTTGQSGRQLTTGQQGGTTGQPERATTGQEWPRNSQENSQGENSQVGRASAPTTDGPAVRLVPSPEPVAEQAALDVDVEPVKAKRASKSKTRCPETWEITPALRAWAAEKVPSVDVDAETEQWLDHHHAAGTLGLDWTAAWRYWMRNSVRFAARRNGGRPDVRHVDKSSAEHRAAREGLTS